MTDKSTETGPDAAGRARAAHAALIDATLRAIDTLPLLSPDASPQGFAALKRAGADR